MDGPATTVGDVKEMTEEMTKQEVAEEKSATECYEALVSPIAGRWMRPPPQPVTDEEEEPQEAVGEGPATEVEETL